MAQVRLLNITWQRGSSPFGTYVAGDVIDVYWDDSTNAVVVKLNSVVITSGSDIPTIFNTPRRTSSYIYLKTETLYQSQICDGDDLYQFGRIVPFPYLNFLKLADHPSCDITGSDLVCDVHFNALPIITPCTTATSRDGTITVSATSSFGTVKYRLNNDFEFNSGKGAGKGRDPETGTGGTSNPVFSDLSPGNYIIYARDVKNCLSIITCAVPVQKTYGTKDQIEFYNPLGYRIKTEILELDYTGGITEITGQDIPLEFNKRGEGERDKFINLVATETVLNLIADTDDQFTYIYTNNPNKYRVRISIDYGSGYEVVWVGSVVPQQYHSTYDGNDDQVQIVASCGIPALKNMPFRDDSGNRLVGSYKQIEIIAWILRKLELGLSIKVGINMYEDGMNTTASDDPLDQAYVDVQTYYLIDENISCSDVLKYILKTYTAQIIQWGNYWNITKILEKIDNYDYRVFDVNGIYISNSSYDPVKYIKYPTFTNSLHWMGNNARKDLLPGFGEIRLNYRLGLKPNIFVNGDFSVRKYSILFDPIQSDLNWEGSAPDTTGFQVVNNETIVYKQVESIDEIGNVAFVLSCLQAGAFIVTTPLFLKTGSADSIKVTYIFKVNIKSSVSRGGFEPYIKVKISVRYGSYYLTNGGEWTTDVNTITIIVGGDAFNKYQTLEITAPNPDVAYIDGEYISVKMYLPNAGEGDYSSRAELETIATVNTSIGTKVIVKASATAGGLTADYLYYYELKQETAASKANKPDVITPPDYNGSTNPVKWILEQKLSFREKETFIFIDKIQVEIFSQGLALPEEAVFTKPMEAGNPETLIETVYHGSYLNNGQKLVNEGNVALSAIRTDVTVARGGITTTGNRQTTSFYPGYFLTYTTFQAESAGLIYAAYLRDSNGVGLVYWTRDGFNELETMHRIIVDEYASQYRRSWERLVGSLVSHDIMLTPLDVVYNVDTDKMYDPIALSINLKENKYNGQFLEIITDAVADFNLDFNFDFNS